MSGGYEDDHDEGDTISYTGSGGSNQKGDKRQMRSQEMNPANQALVVCPKLFCIEMACDLIVYVNSGLIHLRFSLSE